MMGMPKPTEEHERLARLAGNWIGEETMHPSPWAPTGGKATGRFQARIDLDGFHLIADYQQERDSEVTFRGHGVYGWDARGKRYAMHWFDSSGIEHGAPAAGSWEGDRLTLRHHLAGMGYTRYVYDVADGEYRMRIEFSQDGEYWAAFIDAVYRRVE